VDDRRAARRGSDREDAHDRAPPSAAGPHPSLDGGRRSRRSRPVSAERVRPRSGGHPRPWREVHVPEAAGSRRAHGLRRRLSGHRTPTARRPTLGSTSSTDLASRVITP